MQINRNVLKTSFAAAATAVALLAPAMPASAATTTTSTTTAAADIPCGESTTPDYSTRNYHNCTDHPVKAFANYIDGWKDSECVPAGGTYGFVNAGLLFVIEDGTC